MQHPQFQSKATPRLEYKLFRLRSFLQHNKMLIKCNGGSLFLNSQTKNINLSKNLNQQVLIS